MKRLVVFLFFTFNVLCFYSCSKETDNSASNVELGIIRFDISISSNIEGFNSVFLNNGNALPNSSLNVFIDNSTKEPIARDEDLKVQMYFFNQNNRKLSMQTLEESEYGVFALAISNDELENFPFQMTVDCFFNNKLIGTHNLVDEVDILTTNYTYIFSSETGEFTFTDITGSGLPIVLNN